MSIRALKGIAAITLTVVASAMMLQVHPGLASSDENPPLVREISIQNAPGGAVIINIAVTSTVPYRTLQLSGPDRLVVDLKGAHEADLRRVYPAESQVLERVRASQWQSNPAVVRVVADLKGNPAFSVKSQASGIRIELKPRSADVEQDYTSATADAGPPGDAGNSDLQTANELPSPKTAFPVHRFKDLSASLTAPVLPPHDRLIPVANPDPPTPSPKESAGMALVSGISIKPDSEGITTIDIASSRSIPYRVFQLADPFRLVIDLKDARNTSSQKVFQVDSPVLKRVRVGQWRSGNPPVVRVVADLEGYPIFDVHAQRPGIRIELKPRQTSGLLFRNPFEFRTEHQNAAAGHPVTSANQALTSGANSPAAAPGNAFSGLKVIGFIDKSGGIQAVISDHTSVYLVPKGGTFEKTFTVLAISRNAVQIQNIETQETSWLSYVP